MAGFILTFILWGYSVLLFALFFEMALGRRYSVKAVVLGSVAYYLAMCVLRIPVLINTGMEHLKILNSLGMILFFAYQIIFFKGKWYMRILAITVIMLFMQLVEILAGNVTMRLLGGYELYTLNSLSYVVTNLGCILFSTLFIQPVVWLWNMFTKTGKKGIQKTWLCILFPISQYLVMEAFFQKWALDWGTTPWIIIIGVVLGTVATIYAFLLLYRESERTRIEKELRREQHLYQIEQERYENLKSMHTEMGKIRHDYQNQMLVMVRLLQNEGEENRQ